MNYPKKLPLTVLVSGLLFIVVIAVLLIFSNKFRGNTKPENQKDVTGEVGLSFPSLKNAIAEGMTMKCSWGVEDLYSGEAFVKEGMVYINYKPGWESPVSHLIIKDNCMWTWKEGESGRMICLEKTEDFYDSTSPPESQDKQMLNREFNCIPAELDDSLFEVPENIAFYK